MPSLLSAEDRAWAGRALGGRVAPIRRLKGGISAQTLLDELEVRGISAQPVPDRPFWDLLSTTRCVGIADAWYESWLDFGIPGITLPAVEDRLAAFVARALSEL